jgi:HEAT repeat protein
VGAAAASIERALGWNDAEERRQATAELGSAPLDVALPLLVRALGDEDWRVRKEATIAARAFGAAPTLCDALIAALDDRENVGLRNAAVDVLASAGSAATAALGAALPKLDADGRKLVVETLGKGKDSEALQAVRPALDDPDDNVRQGAIEAVAALGAVARDGAEEILIARLDDRDRVVRLTALEGLTALGVAIPWSRLAPLLEDPTLRGSAIAAAAISGSPEAPRALASVLATARGSAFDQALRALARLADGPLASAVADALADGGPDLGQRLVAAALPDAQGDDRGGRRATALRLASAARAPGVVDAAILALADDLLAEPAQRALATMGATALPEVIARLDDASLGADVRASLVDTVGRASNAETGGADRIATLAALRKAAADPERQVAMRALVALSKLGGEADLEIVAELTLARARVLAAAAETALAALAARWPAAAIALADRLSARERSLLPAAVLLGASAGALPFDDRHAAFLAHAATAEDAGARRAAVCAVAEARAAAGAAFPGAMEILRIALADEEHEVQIAAARALGRLCIAKDAPRASSVLDLVERSGRSDLVAAAVRAIGEGFGEAREGAEPPPDLVPALGLFARGAPSAVAVAALDALAHARRAGARSAESALVAALDHPDEAVAKAALLKLSVVSDDAVGRQTLDRALHHPRPSIRALAAELSSDRREGGS